MAQRLIGDVAFFVYDVLIPELELAAEALRTLQYSEVLTIVFRQVLERRCLFPRRLSNRRRRQR